MSERRRQNSSRFSLEEVIAEVQNDSDSVDSDLYSSSDTDENDNDSFASSFVQNENQENGWGNDLNSSRESPPEIDSDSDYEPENLSKRTRTIESSDDSDSNTIANTPQVTRGYVADKEYIAKTIEIVKDIKKHNPDIVYVCDPVLGDNGEDYFTVRKETECVFRDILVPMCDVTTPNQFEAECLSGIKIQTQDNAIKAMRTIHDIGPSIVVITSVKTDTENNDVIVAMASSYKDSVQEVYRIEFPRIDEYLIGTGDLFAGCFTGLLHKSDSMKTAFEKAISICQVVCQRTIVDARKRAGPGNKPTQHQLDLRLPKCAKFLMDPTVEYPAIKIM